MTISFSSCVVQYPVFLILHWIVTYESYRDEIIVLFSIFMEKTPRDDDF